jgi:hypothetical protein
MVLDFNDYIKTPEFKVIKEEILNNHKMFVYKVNKKTNKYKLIIKGNEKKEINEYLEKKYKNKNMDDYYFIYFKIEFHKYDPSHLLTGSPISILSQVYLFDNNKIIKGLSNEDDDLHDLYFDMSGHVYFSQKFIKENKFIKNLLKYFDNIIKKLVNKKEKIVPIGINFYHVDYV